MGPFLRFDLSLVFLHNDNSFLLVSACIFWNETSRHSQRSSTVYKCGPACVISNCNSKEHSPFEKPSFAHPVNIFVIFDPNRRLIKEFTVARYLTNLNLVHIRQISSIHLLLSSRLGIGLSSSVISLSFTTKILYEFLIVLIYIGFKYTAHLTRFYFISLLNSISSEVPHYVIFFAFWLFIFC
jgi:hypothetical protein